MTYSDIALYAVFFAVVTDLYFIKVQMITRGIFWLSYGLIFPFQLLTNWWLTSSSIVIYSPETITGPRFAGAPIEDLLFGFSMILLSLSFWDFYRARDKKLISK